MNPRPLEGRVVVVTRRPEQARDLVLGLEAQGATVIHLPGLEIVPPRDIGPLDAAVRDLSRFDWVAFTSANAVRAVAERLAALGLPATIPVPQPRVAVVGPATAEAVAEHLPGVSVALRPAGEESGRALGSALAPVAAGATVLLPVSSRGRPELEEGLRAAGAHVVRVVAYETRRPDGLEAAVGECLGRRPDLFVFASPSAAEGLADPRLSGFPGVVIGPTTESAARRAGFAVKGVAPRPTPLALVEAAVRALGGALPGDPPSRS